LEGENPRGGFSPEQWISGTVDPPLRSIVRLIKFLILRKRFFMNELKRYLRLLSCPEPGVDKLRPKAFGIKESSL
jgi:hypothetical protein